MPASHTTKSVLVFEDRADQMAKLFKAVQAELKPGEVMRITWYGKPCRMPKNEEVQHGLPYPLRVSRNDLPTVWEVTSTSLNNTVGGETHWQEDFDAAVLDVFYRSNSNPVGHWFARWLSRARFSGLVVLVSVNPLAAEDFGLPNVVKIKRAEAAGDWPQQIARALAGVRPRDEYQVLTDVRGRDPQHLLRNFWDLRPDRRRGALAYFGDDAKLAESLVTFFHCDPFQRGAPPGFDQIEQALFAPRRPGFLAPGVIVVDRGVDGTVDDAFVQRIDELDDALDYRPVWLLLATVQETSHGAALRRLNAVVVDRERMRRGPSIWAMDAVGQLHSTYDVFRRAYPGPISDLKRDDGGRWDPHTVAAAHQLLSALLGPLALARAMDKLVNGEPSLVAWLDPQRTNTLNSSFASVPRHVARAMNRQGHVTERQMALFAPKSLAES